jgi:hypothetical protein
MIDEKKLKAASIVYSNSLAVELDWSPESASALWCRKSFLDGVRWQAAQTDESVAKLVEALEKYSHEKDHGFAAREALKEYEKNK